MSTTNRPAVTDVPVVKEKMSRRHVLVIVTGIMITFGCSALVFSTWGLFQPVVSDALGIPTTRFALYITILYLTMTACSPFAGKILQTADVRIVLTIAACLVSAGFCVMSFTHAIWVFYVAGVLLGIGEIFILWLAVPTLINNWFAERAGFFIGICMAFTGVGGAVWAAVFTALNSGGTDFHTIYRIWAVIALVTSVPFTLFCVRRRPEDVGLVAYGARTARGAVVEPARGVSVSSVMRSPIFYSLCLFACVINIVNLISMQFPTYTKQLTDVGFDVVVVGGVMTTVMMVGQALGKIVLGTVADRTSRGALIFAFIAGSFGVLLCWLGFRTSLVLYSGAFVFGFFYATAVVLVPVMTRDLFGRREYPLIYSRVSTAFNLVGAFASMIWAWIGSSYGFSTLFLVGLAMIVVVFVLGLVSLQGTKRLRDQWT